MTESNGAPNVPPPPRPEPPFLAFASLIDRLADDADQRHAAKQSGKPLGAITGLKALDEQIGGAFAPGLHIVHGSPGVGKTAFCLQIGTACGCPCLYVTTEMTPLELLRRHAARVTKTFLGKFKDGTLTGLEVRNRAQSAAKTAPFFALLDATEEAAEPEHILRAAAKLRSLDESNPHFLLIVDSLHTWADRLGSEGQAEYDRLNEGLIAIGKLSKRLNCAVLAIAERNRGSMSKGGQSAAAGTRKFEYGTETVIELDAKSDQDDADGAKEVKVTISKNRNGTAGGSFTLRFFGALQKYTDDRGQF